MWIGGWPKIKEAVLPIYGQVSEKEYSLSGNVPRRSTRINFSTYPYNTKST